MIKIFKIFSDRNVDWLFLFTSYSVHQDKERQ